MSRIRLTALACCLGLLAAPAAFGQGGGGGSSGGSGGGSSGGASGSASGGATGSTSGATSPGGAPGTSQQGTSILGSGSSGGGASGGAQGGAGGQTGASPGPTGPNRRAQTEGLLRERGVAPSPQQEQQQLRDLNAITRQFTPPGTAVPAPEAER